MEVVIPLKLGFSASVGFIHKESVTMHGHTIGTHYHCIHHFILEAFFRCSVY
jgi:hypothetical protein